MKTVTLKSDFGPEADAALDEACALFPDTFGLRNYEGTFRVNRRNSYVSRGRLMIYTDMLRDGKWCDFCKGTVDELNGQIVKIATMNRYNLRLSFVARKIGSIGVGSHVSKRFENIEAKDQHEAVEKARTLIYNDYEHVGMISARIQ